MSRAKSSVDQAPSFIDRVPSSVDVQKSSVDLLPNFIDRARNFADLQKAQQPSTWAAAALLAGGATFMRWRKLVKVS